MSTPSFDSTAESAANQTKHATNRRPWILTSVVGVPASVGVLAWVLAQGVQGPVEMAAAVVAAAMLSFVVGSLLRSRSDDASPLDLAGLAGIIDAERVDGVVTKPLAAAVIELRGIAADTVVDGADAWSEPVGVIAKRLVEAELPAPALIARLGPHSFGAVFSADTRSDALAIAETLVAMCRIPIRTPNREIRVDAVAGVSHTPAGCRVRGEELLRSADASMRVDATAAGPVATSGERLRRHARRVVEVETEIRHSLDVDLLTARLAPVVDVHSDEVIGLRSGYDWTAVSSTDPEMLRSIAGSLGLRRSIETQYLMRSISAAESLGDTSHRQVYARIDADRVIDDRAVAQLGMLIRASGIAPQNLVLELDGWGAQTLGSEATSALRSLGVGVGINLRHHATWEPVPGHLTGEPDSISVSAIDLIEGEEVSALRVSRLARIVDGDLSRVTVVDVDSASVALELSAAGLSTQSGRVHGRPLAARDLNEWLSNRLAT
ncbi:MAG: hypothetical protein AAGA37_03175 [Actinomycetota bacterium]